MPPWAMGKWFRGRRLLPASWLGNAGTGAVFHVPGVNGLVWWGFIPLNLIFDQALHSRDKALRTPDVTGGASSGAIGGATTDGRSKPGKGSASFRMLNISVVRSARASLSNGQN